RCVGFECARHEPSIWPTSSSIVPSCFPGFVTLAECTTPFMLRLNRRLMPRALEADTSPTEEAATSSPEPNGDGAWNGTAALRDPEPSDLRQRARVAPELATVRTSPDV